MSLGAMLFRMRSGTRGDTFGGIANVYGDD